MKTYCPLPFRHVYVDGSGIKPCCSYTRNYSGSIEEWLQSSELQQLQQQILNNEIPQGCRSCIHNEQNNLYGTRLGALNDYSNVIISDTNIDYVDYRSVNICNFKCRSCEPLFSNGIQADLRKSSELNEFYSVIPTTKLSPTTVNDKEWIIEHLPQIKRLMFTGGEPTKIAAVKEIIEKIINQNLDVNIMITTNCSFTDNFWLEVTKNISNIHWTCSLDAIGQPAEIIRHGTHWPTVKKNIETLFDISPSVNIGTVITNLSLFHLKDLFEYANKLKDNFSNRANGRTQLIEICSWPEYMNPYNWPDDIKPMVMEYLHSIDLNSLQPRQKSTVENFLNRIPEYKFNPVLWDKSERYNKILDKMRSQDHTSLLTAHKYPANKEKPNASK